jgi:hypothetical protein
VPLPPSQWGFSPDQRGVVFHYHVPAEQEVGYLWWFPTSELVGPEIVINTGDFAHLSGFESPWQPAP